MADIDVGTLVAVGVGPNREHPEEVFDLTCSIFQKADITPGQLEQTCILSRITGK